MVGIGTLLALLSAVHLYVGFRHKRLPTSRWFYRAALVAGPLTVVALIAGWITTEVGRQPWVVYGVMRTSAAVSGAHEILIGYGTRSSSGCSSAATWTRMGASKSLPPTCPEYKRKAGPPRLGWLAITCLLAGCALLVVADSGWAHAVGVASLVASAASSFVLASDIPADRADE